MSYCPNCGNLLKEGDLFCSKCGKSLRSNTSQGIQVNVTRSKGFVAALAKYTVYINGSEAGSMSNGETITLNGLDNQKFLLKVQPWGDSVSLHRMACEVEIDPSRCRTNIVNCKVVTEAKALGVIAPLFSAPGKITIYVEYQ